MADLQTNALHAIFHATVVASPAWSDYADADDIVRPDKAIYCVAF